MVPCASTALALPAVVGDHGAQVLGGLQERGAAGLGGGAEGDVQPDGVGPQVVQYPQFTGGFEDDPGAVRGGVADVEVLVVGVPAQVLAVGKDRVEVAVALVVGQEGDPAVHPQGVGEVAVQVRQQPFEFAVAVSVDPQLPGGAAAVPLPPGRFAGQHAGHHDGPLIAHFRAEGHRLHGTEREFFGRSRLRAARCTRGCGGFRPAGRRW